MKICNQSTVEKIALEINQFPVPTIFYCRLESIL